MKQAELFRSLPVTPDEDTRVRCWDCRLWTHHLQVKIHSLTGEPARWANVRVCSKGLAYHPYVLRRCCEFRQLPPGRRMPVGMLK